MHIGLAMTDTNSILQQRFDINARIRYLYATSMQLPFHFHQGLVRIRIRILRFILTEGIHQGHKKIPEVVSCHLQVRMTNKTSLVMDTFFPTGSFTSQNPIRLQCRQRLGKRNIRHLCFLMALMKYTVSLHIKRIK